MTSTSIASVDLGPFRVADISATEVVSSVVRLSESQPNRPVMVFALHVGGLNHRDDPEFVRAMQDADLVYADGGSIVWLGRRAGGQHIERAATTDIGRDILHQLTVRRGAPPRVALLGGAPGLAERAGHVLAEDGVAEVVHTEHGYHEDWTGPLALVREVSPDVTLVGLGAPREMLWAQRMREHLPAGIILTCGGWYGHLVGDERRAPRVLRKPGLEWIARVAQQPTRLGPRYLRGIRSTAAVGGIMRVPGGPRS